MSPQGKLPSYKVRVQLEKLYDHFNKELFGGELKLCIFPFLPDGDDVDKGCFETMTSRIMSEEDRIRCQEFIGYLSIQRTSLVREERKAMSTFVHEMVHAWQCQLFDKTPGHHDETWGRKMESIGLIPSSTGEPGGEKTGRKVSHYIDDNGAFASAYNRVEGTIDWRSVIG